jgi:hypothetical protein
VVALDPGRPGGSLVHPNYAKLVPPERSRRRSHDGSRRIPAGVVGLATRCSEPEKRAQERVEEALERIERRLDAMEERGQ